MSGPQRSNSELVAAYLDAAARKDPSAVDQFFAPNARVYGERDCRTRPRRSASPISADCHAALPWLGLDRGREEVKTFLAHMHRNVEVTAFGPREVISEGNRPAAFGWFRLHALRTGCDADIGYAIRFEVRDGLIAKYHFLENTFDVAGAFRSGRERPIEADNEKHRVPSLSVKTERVH